MKGSCLCGAVAQVVEVPLRYGSRTEMWKHLPPRFTMNFFATKTER